MSASCVLCGKEGEDLCGYPVCTVCKKDIGLLTDETIQKHLKLHTLKKRSYEDEIKRRLDFIDKDYIKKRIKLLHVKERLKEI